MPYTLDHLQRLANPTRNAPTTKKKTKIKKSDEDNVKACGGTLFIIEWFNGKEWPTMEELRAHARRLNVPITVMDGDKRRRKTKHELMQDIEATLTNKKRRE